MTPYDTAVLDLIKAAFDVIDGFSATTLGAPLTQLEPSISTLHRALAALEGAPSVAPNDLTRDIAQQLLDAQRGGHKMTERVCQWAEYVLRRDTADELTAEAQRLGLYDDPNDP